MNMQQLVNMGRVLFILGLAYVPTNTLAYTVRQEDSFLQGTTTISNSRTTLTPGVAQTKTSSGVLKVVFKPTANFIAVFDTSQERTNCLSGCRDGVTFATGSDGTAPSVQWRQGAALGVTKSFSLRNENNLTRTFTAVGSGVTRDTSKVVADSSYRNISDFGDGIARHYNPWINVFTVPQDPPYLFHGRNGESYTFSVPLSVPTGTESGTYTGTLPVYINYQYCGTSCTPIPTQGTRWLTYTNPNVTVVIPRACNFSTSSITIDYGSLSRREVQGKVSSPATTKLTCNGLLNNTTGILKLTSNSGQNWSANTGTSVKVATNIDAILKVNGKNATNGISIPIGSQGSTATFDITSELNTNGIIPDPGTFSGTAILTFTLN